MFICSCILKLWARILLAAFRHYSLYSGGARDVVVPGRPIGTTITQQVKFAAYLRILYMPVQIA